MENQKESITPELHLVRVVLEENYWLIGYVVDEAVRVLDVVENGQSLAEMTGRWPRLKPVTFEYLRTHDFSWRIEPYEEDLQTLEPPERWPTPEEVMAWNL